MAVATKSLDACLIEEGSISEAVLEKARERQREGKRLGDVLQEMGAIDGRAWAHALAAHFGLPFVDELPADDPTASECVEVLPINFAKRYADPADSAATNGTVVVAAADPRSLGPLDDCASCCTADPRRRRPRRRHRRPHQSGVRSWLPARRRT